MNNRGLVTISAGQIELREMRYWEMRYWELRYWEMKHADGKLMLRVKLNGVISGTEVTLYPLNEVSYWQSALIALSRVQGSTERFRSTKRCNFFTVYIIIRLPSRDVH